MNVTSGSISASNLMKQELNSFTKELSYQNRQTATIIISLQVGNQTTDFGNLHNDIDVKIEREALFLVHEGWQESVFSVQIVYSKGCQANLGPVTSSTSWSSCKGGWTARLSGIPIQCLH